VNLLHTRPAYIIYYGCGSYFSLKDFHKWLKSREIKDPRKFSAIWYANQTGSNMCLHHVTQETTTYSLLLLIKPCSSRQWWTPWHCWL